VAELGVGHAGEEGNAAARLALVARALEDEGACMDHVATLLQTRAVLAGGGGMVPALAQLASCVVVGARRTHVHALHLGSLVRVLVPVAAVSDDRDARSVPQWPAQLEAWAAAAPAAMTGPDLLSSAQLQRLGRRLGRAIGGEGHVPGTAAAGTPTSHAAALLALAEHLLARIEAGPRPRDEALTTDTAVATAQAAADAVRPPPLGPPLR
jgi:hypothetical protein